MGKLPVVGEYMLLCKVATVTLISAVSARNDHPPPLPTYTHTATLQILVTLICVLPVFVSVQSHGDV
jgi:hypothetical protein